MADQHIARRQALKTLGEGLFASSVLRVIPLAAAQHVHDLIAQEKTSTGAASYQPRFFKGHEWATLRRLCELVIPPDEKSGGALEANAPEFIDLLTSESEEFQNRLGGGLFWLNAYCRKNFGQTFLSCSPDRQKAVLDLLAFRKNSTPEISQGVHFFALLRDLTVDGFYTSKIGIEDVGYVGNTAMSEFPGCPELPEG